ncbi:LLM class flavin-dependent oxidoreductase [Nocardia sp. alder85J]|uniref:LLM class flavin-dependent oxidoreductase n=1 Tax=Nocardia sp. alder85J TaxID=2862949 RepID=UPI001CD20488|nr:LLM class flavin-dependent oxidoreductase [Nocardia sp. alder85J]MCX4095834.1 LLM class flavin-dependent oxidoreductase [Nocardia sp. alder85J]
MKVTYQMFFTGKSPELSDVEFYRREMALAELAEPLGFEGIWCVEHHFDGPYSMCPDNFSVLSYLAAKTERITLTTGGAILPWNDPLRVAEKLALLDNLSGGRAQLGVGRGLSKIEYDTFGIPMGEARGRMEESLDMILAALNSGVMEHRGEFYRQNAAPIRPAPLQKIAPRDVVSIAMSAESRVTAAERGTAIASFAQFPTEAHAADFAEYREIYRKHHDDEPPRVILSDSVYCSEDAAECEATSKEAIFVHFGLTMAHYGLDKSGHFDNISGYQNYAAMADAMIAAGKEAAAEGYWAAQLTGTPEQIVARIKERYDLFGDYDQNCGFSCGGMDHDKAEASMRLFAEKVMPELRRLGIPVREAATV